VRTHAVSVIDGVIQVSPSLEEPNLPQAPNLRAGTA